MYLPPELWLIIDNFVFKIKFMNIKRKLEKILKFPVKNTLFNNNNCQFSIKSNEYEHYFSFYNTLEHNYLDILFIKYNHGHLSHIIDDKVCCGTICNLSNNIVNFFYFNMYFNHVIKRISDTTNINKILNYKCQLSKIKSKLQFKEILSNYSKVEF